MKWQQHYRPFVWRRCIWTSVELTQVSFVLERNVSFHLNQLLLQCNVDSNLPIGNLFTTNTSAMRTLYVFNENRKLELYGLAKVLAYLKICILFLLTHWGRVTHICVDTNTNIGSDNGLSPGRRQAIIWTNAGILLIGPLGTNFSGILIKIHTFSFTKMRLKMSSGKWRPSCLGLNIKRTHSCYQQTSLKILSRGLCY